MKFLIYILHCLADNMQVLNIEWNFLNSSIVELFPKKGVQEHPFNMGQYAYSSEEMKSIITTYAAHHIWITNSKGNSNLKNSVYIKTGNKPKLAKAEPCPK